VFVYSVHSSEVKRVFSSDLSRFGWGSCEKCSFNRASTFLMVSGSLANQIVNKERGEAMVFNVKGKFSCRL
jgi:hypothetical protein